MPTEGPFVTPTRAVSTATATYPPLPTVLPTVIDPNAPTPTDYPPQLPRAGSEVVSESSGSSITDDVNGMTYVIRARVAKIDPPFWSTIDGKRPSIVESSDITSPALLNVEEVYKGPSISSLEVGIGGYCFTPTSCTPRPFQFTWEDLVGYDLILFIIEQPQVGGRPQVPTRAYPYATYVIHPNASRDELLFIHSTKRITLSRSGLESSIRAAPSANHGKTLTRAVTIRYQWNATKRFAQRIEVM
jgi:hypothetical protein